MSELKPCPFCGGRAVVRAFTISRSFVVCCEDCPIGFLVPYDSEEEAVEAWNTRAERTCRVVKNSRKYVLSDGTELFDDGCSICNGYIGAGENYCSNCGAKVVE